MVSIILDSNDLDWTYRVTDVSTFQDRLTNNSLAARKRLDLSSYCASKVFHELIMYTHVSGDDGLPKQFPDAMAIIRTVYQCLESVASHHT